MEYGQQTTIVEYKNDQIYKITYEEPVYDRTEYMRKKLYNKITSTCFVYKVVVRFEPYSIVKRMVGDGICSDIDSDS